MFIFLIHIILKVNAYITQKIDKQEWRDYRLILKSWTGVRKCGRNFLRFCDQNRDRKITSAEWMECTVRSYQGKQLCFKIEYIRIFI